MKFYEFNRMKKIKWETKLKVLQNKKTTKKKCITKG